MVTDNRMAPVATVDDRTVSRADLDALYRSHGGAPVRLRNCDLARQDLSGAHLAGWVLEHCDLTDAIIRHLQAEDSRWQACRAASADFVEADFTSATFQACNLANTAWGGARLTQAVFHTCRMTGAALTHARTVGLVLEECQLAFATLRGLSFRRQTLNKLDLTDADLGGCDFRDCVFVACRLRDASLRQARFEGADLRGADLGELRLNDAPTLKGALISRDQAQTLLGGFGIMVI